MKARCWELSSDDRRSAIHNPKWTAILALFIQLVMGGKVLEAQQPTKISRIGWLAGNSLSSMTGRIEAFRRGLRELSYVEGKNIVIEWRSANGKNEIVPALAAELVALNVDVIVASGPQSTRS